MPNQLTLAYADSVNQQACDDFSSDFRTLADTEGVTSEFQQEFETFAADLHVAATETRKLIAEIEALTR